MRRNVKVTPPCSGWLVYCTLGLSLSLYLSFHFRYRNKRGCVWDLLCPPCTSLPSSPVSGFQRRATSSPARLLKLNAPDFLKDQSVITRIVDNSHTGSTKEHRWLSLIEERRIHNACLCLLVHYSCTVLFYYVLTATGPFCFCPLRSLPRCIDILGFLIISGLHRHRLLQASRALAAETVSHMRQLYV